MVIACSKSVASVVLETVQGWDCVGFSGSRILVADSLRVARWAATQLADVRGFVGCASGADAVFRAGCSGLEVLEADRSLGKGGFAQRSISMVRHVANGGGGLVSFPDKPCPSSLVPHELSSRAFCGSGSGSWATLSYAIGLGLPCLVWLPPQIAAPSGWGLRPLGRGWYCAPRKQVRLPLSL